MTDGMLHVIFLVYIFSLFLKGCGGKGDRFATAVAQSAVRDDWNETTTISSINSDQPCGYLRGEQSILVSYGCLLSMPLNPHQFKVWMDHHLGLGNGVSADASQILISFRAHLTILNVHNLENRWYERMGRGDTELWPSLDKVSLTFHVEIGGQGGFPVTVYPFASDEFLQQRDGDNRRMKTNYEENVVFNIGWRVGVMPSEQYPGDFSLTIHPQTMDLVETTVPVNDQVLVMLRNVSIVYVPPVEKVPLIQRDVRSVLTRGIHSVDESSIGEVSVLRNMCRLFGSPNAVILHQIHISNKHFRDSFSYSLNRLTQKTMNGDYGHDIINEGSNTTPLPRVFCGVFTVAKHHDTHIKAMKDTWTKKCHAFLAFSTVNDPDVPSIDLPHFGPESYMNMWQKTRSIWKYIHTHYLEEFDYFLLGGDDMYYIMENLYAFLAGQRLEEALHSNTALYLGRKFQYLHNNNQTYNTGGPGYILNQAALKVLFNALESDACNPHIMHSIEDVLLADCFQKQTPPIYPYDTTDERSKQRFHYFSPGYLFDPIDNDEIAEEMMWVRRSDPTPSYGLDCCSPFSIAFHYIEPTIMQEIDDFLYRCPRSIVRASYKEQGEGYYAEDFRIVAQKKSMVTPH